MQSPEQKEKEVKDFLVASGFVSARESAVLSDDELRRAHARALGVPFVELSRDDISLKTLSFIPEPVSRHHSAVAFNETERGVEVAVLDLEDVEVLQDMQLPKRVLPRLTSRESMTRALLIYQKVLKEQYGDEITRALANESVNELIDVLLRHALTSGACTIYIEERPEGVSVRYRITHALYEAMMLPTRVTETLFGVLGKLINAKVDIGEAVRIRGHHAQSVSGRKSTLHLVRDGSGRHGFTLETLGFHGYGLERVHEALAHKSGIILVSGEKGSGRTTTLYTLLDLLVSPSRTISTVEEKVELKFPRVSQAQVDNSVGLTTAAALRSVLRHDPDVVLVGDISDVQTALVVAQAARRGVLVLAGIEAHSAASGVEKLLAFGVSEAVLEQTLRLSAGVALASKIKEPMRRTLARDEDRSLEKSVDFVKILTALKDEGVVDRSAQWKDVKFAFDGVDTGKNIGLQEVFSFGQETELSLAEDRVFKAARGDVTMV